MRAEYEHSSDEDENSDKTVEGISDRGLLGVIDVDYMDGELGKCLEHGPQKGGAETDAVDLVDGKPVEEEQWSRGPVSALGDQCKIHALRLQFGAKSMLEPDTRSAVRL